MNEDLIRALRCTKNENADCRLCKYQVLHEGGYDYCDQERLEIDAEEALKDLGTENTALRERLTRVTDERGEAMPMKSNRFDHIIETLVIVIIRMSVYYGAALLFIALFAFAVVGGTAFSRLIGIDENIVAIGLMAACLVAAIIRQCVKRDSID